MAYSWCQSPHHSSVNWQNKRNDDFGILWNWLNNIGLIYCHCIQLVSITCRCQWLCTEMEFVTLNETFTVSSSAINSTVGKVDEMSRSEYIFFVAVRGVLRLVIQLTVTFLNFSTIIVIYKNDCLQISSNALVVCFSIGHSFAAIAGILTAVNDNFLLEESKTWTIFCKTCLSIQGFQHSVNCICIMAISIERFYSIKFPIQAFNSNSFRRMMKISRVVLLVSFLQALTMTSIGFFKGYIADYPTACTGHYVFGDEGINLFMITFLVTSLIGLAMTGVYYFHLGPQEMDTDIEPDNTSQHWIQDNQDAVYRYVSFREMGICLLLLLLYLTCK